MAATKRLIDANAFHAYLESIRQDYLEEDTLSSNFAAKVIETVQDECLKNAATVDAVKVVHGRWERLPNYEGLGFCSACKYRPAFVSYKYCPNCGAKMDGDDVKRQGGRNL